LWTALTPPFRRHLGTGCPGGCEAIPSLLPWPAKYSKHDIFSTDKHPFIGLSSRTTWVSWHHKGKTILNFNEARDDGMAVALAEPDADHLHLAAYR